MTNPIEILSIGNAVKDGKQAGIGQRLMDFANSKTLAHFRFALKCTCATRSRIATRCRAQIPAVYRPLDSAMLKNFAGDNS
jgi:hypothetical protein